MVKQSEYNTRLHTIIFWVVTGAIVVVCGADCCFDEDYILRKGLFTFVIVLNFTKASFILLDTVVLSVALCRIFSFLKDQPLLRANEKYMFVHIMMLCLLLAGNISFQVTYLIQDNDNLLIYVISFYAISDIITNLLMAWIMIKVMKMLLAGKLVKNKERKALRN